MAIALINVYVHGRKTFVEGLPLAVGSYNLVTFCARKFLDLKARPVGPAMLSPLCLRFRDSY